MIVNQAPMTTLRRDTTIRWPCRAKDVLIWFRYGSLFANEPKLEIIDFWELRDGDSIIITNRINDLPPWFELHPTEASGANANKMMKMLNSGYKYPKHPVDGPNIWRVMGGDRLVWLGRSRPGQDAVNGVLSIIDFRNCAIVLGETNDPGLDAFMEFGSPADNEHSPLLEYDIAFIKEQFEQIGLPRVVSLRWALEG